MTSKIPTFSKLRNPCNYKNEFSVPYLWFMFKTIPNCFREHYFFLIENLCRDTKPEEDTYVLFATGFTPMTSEEIGPL